MDNPWLILAMYCAVGILFTYVVGKLFDLIDRH